MKMTKLLVLAIVFAAMTVVPVMAQAVDPLDKWVKDYVALMTKTYPKQKTTVVVMFSQYPALNNYLTDKFAAEFAKSSHIKMLDHREKGIDVSYNPDYYQANRASDVRRTMEADLDVYGKVTYEDGTWWLSGFGTWYDSGEKKSVFTESVIANFSHVGTIAELVPDLKKKSNITRAPAEAKAAAKAQAAAAKAEAKAVAAKEPKAPKDFSGFGINISAFYTYWFPEGDSPKDVHQNASAGYPYFYDSHLYHDNIVNTTLQLSMGLKLFQDLSAFIDFGINDPGAKDALSIAGKVAAKWFDLSLDYHTLSADVRFWKEEDEWKAGAKANEQRTYNPYEETRVALMTPVSLGKEFFLTMPPSLGILFINATYTGLDIRDGTLKEEKDTYSLFGLKLRFGPDPMDPDLQPMSIFGWEPSPNIYGLVRIDINILFGGHIFEWAVMAGAYYRLNFPKGGGFNIGLGMDYDPVRLQSGMPGVYAMVGMKL